MRSFCLMLRVFLAQTAAAQEVSQYSVVQWDFTGPVQTASDTPARDCTLTARFQHESGAEMTVYGYWDGDGQPGRRLTIPGNVFRVRFCPTLPGTWTLIETASNHRELRGQREGESIECIASDLPGLWIAEGRWYRRSDGSHPMIVGNTHYSFLSRHGPEGRLQANTDIRTNGDYFNKVRFSLFGDRYPDPELKPFLDDDGQPTDDGRYAHRPNPRWFSARVDPMVYGDRADPLPNTIRDLILCGPDTRDSRSTLQGDNLPWLRYVAARYGSYPNVWFCLCNEWNIKDPSYSSEEIIAAGQTLREHLPHPTTPISVHGDSGPWNADLNGDWCEHAIIQWKLRSLPEAADAAAESSCLADGHPVFNDENGYQGEGDGFSKEDILEGCLGTFLGGGYPTTGEKTGNKLGPYFWGGVNASPTRQSAAACLMQMRRYIDEHVEFWNMSPMAANETPFLELPDGFRVLGKASVEYVLGSNAAAKIECELPPGTWRVVQVDIVESQEHELMAEAVGSFELTTPESRAVMTHLRLIESR